MNALLSQPWPGFSFPRIALHFPDRLRDFHMGATAGPVEDDGGGNDDGSSATSNFVSSLVQSLPPIHDVAKMAGVDLPDYLGSLSEDSDGE